MIKTKIKLRIVKEIKTYPCNILLITQRNNIKYFIKQDEVEFV